MRGKTISIYTGALVITLFGAGATMLIVSAAYSIEEPAYVTLDPFSPEADFGR